MAQITKEQLQKLKAAEIYDYEKFIHLLKEYVGIEARPSSAYQFFDAAGDYIGHSGNDVEELLEAAYAEVK